jgi:DNA helicase-2/ATP-dependent DNA helicase PcrA
VTTVSEYQEAEVITHFLRIARQQLAPSIAILYRAHFQSRVIEEALIKQSMPYKIIGGIQFYERKEIKDLLAYMRLVVNPYDRTAFFRIINYPLRGFGPKFEETFHDQWEAEPLLSFTQLAHKLIEDKKITGTKKTMLAEFIQMYEGIKAEDTPGSIINHLLTSTEYISYTRKNYDPQEAQMRLDNIKELLRAIEHFEEQGIKTVAAFLDEVALLQAKHNEDYASSNPVLLMTLHAAKGLEFDMVVIPGLEDNILPSSRATANPEALEEERRLLYVGITRAKDRLLLTHSRYRTTYGATSDSATSRFIYELPEHLIQRFDVSYWAKPQILDLFAEWFDIKPDITSTTVRHVIQPGKPKPIAHHKPLRQYQTIRHVQFGVGFIQKIQQRGKNNIAEVKFKSGVKKIDTRFLEPL